MKLAIYLLALTLTSTASSALNCGQVVLASADLIGSAVTPRWKEMGRKLIDAGFLAPQDQLEFPKVEKNPKAQEQLDRLKSRAPGWVYLTFYSRLHQRLSAYYGRQTADQFLEATLLRADENQILQTLSPVMAANEIWRDAADAGGAIAIAIRGKGEKFTDENREKGLTTYLVGSLSEIRETVDTRLRPFERLIAELENQQVSCEESHRGGNLICLFPGPSDRRLLRIFPNRHSSEKLADKDGYLCINHRGEDFSLLMAASPYRFVYETPGTLIAQVRDLPGKQWEGGLLRLSPALAKQTLDDINLILEVLDQTSD